MSATLSHCHLLLITRKPLFIHQPASYKCQRALFDIAAAAAAKRKKKQNCCCASTETDVWLRCEKLHHASPSSSSSSSSVQGLIQQLLLRADPTAPDDQCEEDDPNVSVNRHTNHHTNTDLGDEAAGCKIRGSSLPSSGGGSTLPLNGRVQWVCDVLDFSEPSAIQVISLKL